MRIVGVRRRRRHVAIRVASRRRFHALRQWRGVALTLMHLRAHCAWIEAALGRRRVYTAFHAWLLYGTAIRMELVRRAIARARRCQLRRQHAPIMQGSMQFSLLV